LEDAKKKGVRNILRDYGIKLPLQTVADVKKFSEELHINSLKNEEGVTRQRRAELVSFIF
jgi:hypothetical protein